MSPLLLAVPLLLGSACAPLFSQAAPATTHVDFQEVMHYAILANLAYQPDSVVRAAFPNQELAIRELPSVAGRVLVITDHASRSHSVSARGTANVWDVLEDLEYSKRRDDKVDVELHRGFEEYAIVAYDSIGPVLLSGYSVHLTGHSLGGAVAAILMMYLDADGFDIARVVTFGQPKVTNHRGVEKYAGMPVLRVVDCHDPIPLVPPLTVVSAMHGPYRHFGRELVLWDGERYSLLPEHDAERFSVSSFWENLPHIAPGDHHMGSYIARISTKLHGAVPVPYDPDTRCRPVAAAAGPSGS